MKLKYIDSKGNIYCYGEIEDINAAYPIISNYLKEKDFDCHYIRTFQDDNKLYYDFGSWSEFFFVEGLD